jgi:hypothetical protein
LLTNVNTRGGSTNNYVTKFSINGTSWTRFSYIWFNSGSGTILNSWINELRPYRQTPNGNSVTQFSNVSNMVAANGFNSTAYSGVVGPNAIYFYLITSSVSGNVNNISANIAVSATGHVNVALYDATGNNGGPGNLIAYCNQITNPSAGIVSFTPSSNFSVLNGVNYYIAVNSDVGITIYGGIQFVSKSLSYLYSTGFPTSATGFIGNGTTFGLSYFILNVAPFNWFSVSDTIYDGDTTIVYSSTLGQEDLYTLSNVSNLQQIFGITYHIWAKKNDIGGIRNGSIQLIANGSADTSLLTFSPLITYEPFISFQATDPLGITWSTNTVNSATVGIKVSL